MIRTLRRASNRLLGSLWGHRREDDLNEELEGHIRLLAEENIAVVSRRKRPIAEPESSSAGSSQRRRATAISAVSQHSIPSCRIFTMLFGDFVGIPVSPL